MKLLIALCVTLTVCSCLEIDVKTPDHSQYCYNTIVEACSRSKTNKKSNCNARFGALSESDEGSNVLKDLQTYVSTHITRSYEYLMMATHYANYQRNRPGMEKLLRGLSDSKWNQAIELIKYITKRGGEMDFQQFRELGPADHPSSGAYELNEIQSLAKALDIEKKLTYDANRIHREATNRNPLYHDSELSHHIEEEFTEKQADIIRTLSGYTADLSSMLSGNDGSLSLYLFDEHLAKQ